MILEEKKSGILTMVILIMIFLQMRIIIIIWNVRFYFIPSFIQQFFKRKSYSCYGNIRNLWIVVQILLINLVFLILFVYLLLFFLLFRLGVFFILWKEKRKPVL